MIRKHGIDGGKGFDWSKASSDYARFRDIYPPSLYQKLTQMGLCVAGQKVLDLGTGTDAKLPFTRESWNGRIKACRGVDASLSAAEVASFEAEHRALLSQHPESFDILHYVAITVLKRR